MPNNKVVKVNIPLTDDWKKWSEDVFKIVGHAKTIINNMKKGDRKAIKISEPISFIEDIDSEIRFSKIPSNIFYILRTLKEEDTNGVGIYLLDFVCV